MKTLRASRVPFKDAGKTMSFLISESLKRGNFHGKSGNFRRSSLTFQNIGERREQFFRR